jgi:glycosyltransferase involved in cell wall biosynthesis
MPSSKVKISIIIPVYNVEKYLKKCIESVLAQTLRDIEVFLIDDGSTDNSWRLVQKFAERDKRIKAIQQQNMGAAVARNRGLDQAKGEYIGFVDSDDYVDTDYFAKLYEAAIKNDADIARAYVKSEIETGDAYQLAHSVEGYDNYYNKLSKEKVLENKLNLTSSNWLAIYRRSILEENNIRFVPEIRTGQDNIFNLHVSYFANKVVFVDEPTYYHMNRRDGSLMTGYNFTTDGLISRALVIKETVRFLNSVKDYDAEVYAFRIKDVYDFFHSRLIKTDTNKASRRELANILVPIWRQVKHRKAVKELLGHDARFIAALDEREALIRYIAREVPIRQVLSRAEKRRQAFAGKIRANRAAYSVLRPPVRFIRKLNKLVSKVLS